jgi:hypothetical protein
MLEILLWVKANEADDIKKLLQSSEPALTAAAKCPPVKPKQGVLKFDYGEVQFEINHHE